MRVSRELSLTLVAGPLQSISTITFIWDQSNAPDSGKAGLFVATTVAPAWNTGIAAMAVMSVIVIIAQQCLSWSSKQRQ